MYVRSVFVFVRCVLGRYRVFLSKAQRKEIVGKVIKEGNRSCGDDNSDSDSDIVELGRSRVLVRHRVV